MNFFKEGVDLTPLARYSNLSVDDAKKAQYFLMPCAHRLEAFDDVTLHNFFIESDPLVATTPDGRSLLENPNLALADTRTSFSGAGMGILEFADGKKFALVNERDAGAPSFEFNMHFNGGMADARRFAPGYTNTHPLAISVFEFLEETTFFGPKGQIIPIILSLDVGEDIQEKIAAENFKLLEGQKWFFPPQGKELPTKVQVKEFLKEKEEQVIVVWLGHEVVSFSAHCLLSTRTTNIDITKFYHVQLPFLLEETRIYSTEEIAPPNSPAFPLNQEIFLYELNGVNRLTGWVAGSFKSGKWNPYDPQTVPVFRHKHTDPLKEALMIIGFDDESLKGMGFRPKKLENSEKIKSML